MFKRILFVTVLLVVLVAFAAGCADFPIVSTPSDGGTIAKSANERMRTAEPAEDAAEIAALVEEFGRKLQTVSLLAPQDVLEESMENTYGNLVVPELLEAWLENPSSAPGRLTSSPWPDRIEIDRITKLSSTAYEVQGEIIEITSTELDSTAIAGKRRIILVVTRVPNRWLISSVTLGDYQSTEQIIYRNDTYEFAFLLPASWAGYQVIETTWEGHFIGDSADVETSTTGPKLLIRHPLWSENDPRQDIPIMVLTKEQWKAIQREELAVGAAPIGPRKLAENEQYVFALPARYNFSFPTGFEEVEKILANDPLRVDL